jgi:hypothetical protein
MNHLDDLTLFSYLDAALDGREMSGARTHLAKCAFCQARLSAVQTMLAEVDALPDLPLERDLSKAVVATIQAKQHPVAAPKLGRVAGWALAVQALLGLVGVGVAVPLGLELVQAGSLPGVNWQALINQGQSLIIANFSFNWGQMLAGVQAMVPNNQALIPLPTLSLVVVLPLLLAVTGLWVVGNGVLLRNSNRLQRR